jgi:hypothetical protein
MFYHTNKRRWKKQAQQFSLAFAFALALALPAFNQF